MAIIHTYTHHHDHPTVRPLYVGTQIVWYILYIVEILLLFRFVLQLIGANPAGFTNFIYSITYPLVAPFLYVVDSSSIAGAGVLEWSTLLAMLVYWIIAVAIVRLFLISRPVSDVEAEAELEEQKRNV